MQCFMFETCGLPLTNLPLIFKAVLCSLGYNLGSPLFFFPGACLKPFITCCTTRTPLIHQA